VRVRADLRVIATVIVRQNKQINLFHLIKGECQSKLYPN
jgi:hypothetical protein